MGAPKSSTAHSLTKTTLSRRPYSLDAFHMRLLDLGTSECAARQAHPTNLAGSGTGGSAIADMMEPQLNMDLILNRRFLFCHIHFQRHTTYLYHSSGIGAASNPDPETDELADDDDLVLHPSHHRYVKPLAYESLDTWSPSD
ncbi:hypothetical protein HGRIS_013987 [Hohenbuehelia grisea]|uniref:Uncharacterized protein n=1 Tax=Hohenbuehelia grisea TaxID=104357 RepID=A0ABR3JU53_9AGAR